MTPPASVLLLVATALIVVVRFVVLAVVRWNRPTTNGPDFFLGVEVAPEFHGALSARWLRRYRLVLVTEHLAETAAAGILAFSPWSGWLPAWAGGVAVVDLSCAAGFKAWVSHSVPQVERTHVPVAVSLQVRRIRDYTSWTRTVAVWTSLVAGWLFLVLWGTPGWHWQIPAVCTYVALAVFVWKINAVMAAQTLPADRPREHQQWFDERRHLHLRVFECTEWFAAVLVVGYALVHSVSGTATLQFVRWAAIATVFWIWGFQVVVLVRGYRHLAAAGRSLRPPGAWQGLSRETRSRAPRLLTWSLCVGLVVLIAVSLIQLSK
jgi:hypothetical protein